MLAEEGREASLRAVISGDAPRALRLRAQVEIKGARGPGLGLCTGVNFSSGTERGYNSCYKHTSYAASGLFMPHRYSMGSLLCCLL